MTPANRSLCSIAFWGAFQLLMLGLGASGFLLWAHHPSPRESISLSELACGQVILISLVGPSLFPDVWSLWIGMVMMVPIDALAGTLSSASILTTFLTWLIVSLWSAGVTLIAGAFKSNHSKLLVSTIATIWVIGGVMLDYARWEANLAVSQNDQFSTVSFLPKLCAVGTSTSALLWIHALAPFTIALPIHLILGRLTFRSNPSSTSLHTYA